MPYDLQKGMEIYCPQLEATDVTQKLELYGETLEGRYTVKY